ncbi:expressed unknown protein [Seminavis robusta]|uniref:Uncharacterized protein n=1 Tax=Seminavis robusta TaxID=568900 RepID=A0A9N8EJV3_9STRA|nr:expressed unknown protein [Seminavis robusta]|eukprot:Sro1076_g238500.1 n/a (709) ;mRNA; r:7992-10209
MADNNNDEEQPTVEQLKLKFYHRLTIICRGFDLPDKAERKVLNSQGVNPIYDNVWKKVMEEFGEEYLWKTHSIDYPRLVLILNILSEFLQLDPAETAKRTGISNQPAKLVENILEKAEELGEDLDELKEAAASLEKPTKQQPAQTEKGAPRRSARRIEKPPQVDTAQPPTGTTGSAKNTTSRQPTTKAKKSATKSQKEPSKPTAEPSTEANSHASAPSFDDTLQSTDNDTPQSKGSDTEIPTESQKEPSKSVSEPKSTKGKGNSHASDAPASKENATDSPTKDTAVESCAVTTTSSGEQSGSPTSDSTEDMEEVDGPLMDEGDSDHNFMEESDSFHEKEPEKERDSNAESQADRESIQMELDDARKQMASMQEEHATKVEQLRKERDSFRDQLARSQTKVEELQNQLAHRTTQAQTSVEQQTNSDRPVTTAAATHAGNNMPMVQESAQQLAAKGPGNQKKAASKEQASSSQGSETGAKTHLETSVIPNEIDDSVASDKANDNATCKAAANLIKPNCDNLQKRKRPDGGFAAMQTTHQAMKTHSKTSILPNNVDDSVASDKANNKAARQAAANLKKPTNNNSESNTGAEESGTADQEADCEDAVTDETMVEGEGGGDAATNNVENATSEATAGEPTSSSQEAASNEEGQATDATAAPEGVGEPSSGTPQAEPAGDQVAEQVAPPSPGTAKARMDIFMKRYDSLLKRGAK